MSELETPPDSNDPIASLYRMSTTAGVGTSDYVEINKPAVVSVVLALLSLLSVLGKPFLLVGLVALGCGIIGLRQIARSNGTQGGRIIAWVGVLGSLLVAGGVFTGQLVGAAIERRDAGHINALIEQLGTQLTAGKYSEARGLFAPIFQDKLSIDDFKSKWEQAAPSDLGTITKFEGNGRFNFQYGHGGNWYFGFTQVTIEFTAPPGVPRPPGQPPVVSVDTPVVAVKAEDGVWHLYDMPGVFKKVMPIPR